MRMTLYEVSELESAKAHPELRLPRYSASEHIVGKDEYGEKLDVYTGVVLNSFTLEEMRAKLAASPYRAAYRIPDSFKRPAHVLEVWTP